MLKGRACRSYSDEQLMRAYVEGDAQAFDELFRRYEQRAFSYFLGRTRSTERAEDLYQELFLRLHRSRHRFEPGRPFAPWFFQIARRLLIDDYRLAHRGAEVPLDGPEPRDERASVERELEGREQLTQALGDLSNEERHVLLSARLGGRSHADLARELGRSAAAVRKLASRASLRLRAVAEVGPGA